jgi:hypothetical protein
MEHGLLIAYFVVVVMAFLVAEHFNAEGMNVRLS